MDINTLRRLIQKYDRPGPRYTSYPTANHFKPVEDPAPLIEEAAETPGPHSLYFHLPFCETLCWFCGCFTVITKDRSRASNYLDALSAEAELFRELRGSRARINQLHFGGGTPNFLDPGQIDRLGHLIQDNFELLPDAECSVELAPLHLTPDHLAAFRSIGCTRASFGVQDVEPAVQAAINRRQPPALNRQTVTWLRDSGFHSINIDLMYGLPHQTTETFDRTLDSVLALEPDRLAIFNYAHIPWMRPAQKMLEKAGLPSPEAKLSILLRMVERLTDAGFEYIGMDHFARPDDELAQARKNGTLQRNFQGYSTRAGLDILAFGVSAISQTSLAYRQNTKNLSRYASAISTGEFPIEAACVLTEQDRIRRHLIQRLMCDLRIDTHTILQPFKTSFEAQMGDWRELLAEFLDDGLVAQGDEPGSFVVTPIGRYFLRNLAMVFDAHLSPAENTNRFSRTV
ncbi:MAG: oxygen-independent coproporphyrinogen III oxidase [Puniceicoccaceae bacterium]